MAARPGRRRSCTRSPGCSISSAPGQRVINGARALHVTRSRRRCSSRCSRRLGLPAPRSRVIHRPAGCAGRRPTGFASRWSSSPTSAAAASASCASTRRRSLRAAADEGASRSRFDHVALVQEFIPARGGHIVRVEMLGGRYLYGDPVHLSGADVRPLPGRHLPRPATASRWDSGVPGRGAQGRACASMRYEPPAEIAARGRAHPRRRRASTSAASSTSSTIATASCTSTTSTRSRTSSPSPDACSASIRSCASSTT